MDRGGYRGGGRGRGRGRPREQVDRGEFGGGNRGGGDRGGGYDGGQRRGSRGGHGGNRGDSGFSRQFDNLSLQRGGRDPQEYPESGEYPIILRNEKIACGTQGTKIELLANFFPLKMKNAPVVNQYDIVFAFKNPRPGPVDIEKEIKFFVVHGSTIFNAFIKKNSSIFNRLPYVYDGHKNLYTKEDIDTSSLDTIVTCNVKGRNKEFLIKLNLVNQKLDLSLIESFYAKRSEDMPDNVIRFLDLLFGNVITKKYAVHMRKFFDTKNVTRANKAPNFVSFVSGFSDHIRPTEMGLAMNIHVKTSCIINPTFENLKDLVGAIHGRDPLENISDRDIPRINKFIKGLKCFTNHGGCRREYSIKGISSKRPHEIEFQDRKDPNIKTNIKRYFLDKYGIKVQNYPLVNMAGGKDLNVPLELCYLLPNQFLHNSKLNLEMQNDMLFCATKKPIVYMNMVTDYAKEILDIDKEKLTQFGVHYIPKPVRFFGRVLEAPKQHGAKRNDKFFKTTDGPEWIIFSFDSRYNQQYMDKLAEDLFKTSNNFGLKLIGQNCKEKVSLQIKDVRDVINVFDRLVHKYPSCRLAFIVLPPGDSQLYSMVKHCGDQKHGLVTQCLLSSKIMPNIRPGYLDNLLLKVNGKLGGINSIIDDSCLKQLPIKSDKTMVLGIDVNHPSETEQVESSIAAAVGSYDPHFTLYSASLRVQKKEREEIITCLEGMISELMDEYFKKNKYYPDNFIVFRDGVSEGQFQHAETEIRQIRSAIRKVKGGQPYKMVFIVTQKRHSTRFVLAQPGRNGYKETYNVPAGTVVDHTIVEPTHHIFYINSHFSPLGTSKPLKYIVLDNDFSQKVMSTDQLQKLCFYCCHNCTRFRGGAIALPTAVRYADLCAYRSKLHIEVQVRNLPRDRRGASAETLEQKLIEQLNSKVKISGKLKNLLFYC